MPSAHRVDLERAEVGELGEVAMGTVAGRFVARLIDTAIVGIPALLASMLVWPQGDLLTRLVPLVLVAFVYDVMLVSASGTTPGKKLLRLEIVDFGTGRPPSMFSAFVRAAVSVIATPPLLVLSILLIDERTRRGWPDLAAGTVVMLRPAAV